MRTLPTTFASHLASGATTLCNCWKITRKDGSVQGFTDHDKALTFSNVTFEAETGFIGTENIARIGLAVDNIEVHAALSSGRLQESDLINGLYDNAEVEVYLVNWQAPDEHVLMTKGNIGEVRRGQLSFMAEIRGLAHHLQQPQGRMFQSRCDAELGDGRCQVQLNNATYTATATLQHIDAEQTLQTNELPTYSTNWFKGGQLEWLSGLNQGAVFEVKAHQTLTDQTSVLKLWQKINTAPAVGDQFKLTAGCDKLFQTCQTKFANQLNFRGFPHIPGNDFILSTPSQTKGRKDGSSQNR